MQQWNWWAYTTLTSCLNAFFFAFVHFLADSSCCGMELLSRWDDIKLACFKHHWFPVVFVSDRIWPLLKGLPWYLIATQQPFHKGLSFFSLVQSRVVLSVNAMTLKWSTIPGKRILGLIFARYVPLSSQRPFPIIVYSVASYKEDPPPPPPPAREHNIK